MADNKNFKGNLTTMLFMDQDTIDKVDNPEKEEEKPAKADSKKSKGSKASQKKTTAKSKGKGSAPKGKAETSPGREKAPEGYRLNPKYVEVKSKRVQLLVPPRVHEAVKAKAEAEGISTNEAINEALKAYIGE